MVCSHLILVVYINKANGVEIREANAIIHDLNICGINFISYNLPNRNLMHYLLCYEVDPCVLCCTAVLYLESVL